MAGEERKTRKPPEDSTLPSEQLPSKTIFSFWQQLITIKNGRLQWDFTTDPNSKILAHLFPEIYLAISGPPTKLVLTKDQSTPPLTKISPHRYTTDREYTGLNGLLRLTALDEDELKIENFDQIEEIVLCGVWGLNSFYNLLTWLYQQQIAPNITVIDQSSVPLQIIDAAKNMNLWQWSGEVKLVQSKIQSSPEISHAQLIIMDITNPYSQNALIHHPIDQPPPLNGYQQLLTAIAHLKSPEAQVLSRCLIYDQTDINPWPKEVEENDIQSRLTAVLSQLPPEWSAQLDPNQLTNNLQELWSRAYIRYDCGVYQYPNFPQPTFPSQGPEAEARYTQMYRDFFTSNKEVSVRCQNRRWTFRSFLSK